MDHNIFASLWPLNSLIRTGATFRFCNLRNNTNATTYDDKWQTQCALASEQSLRKTCLVYQPPTWKPPSGIGRYGRIKTMSVVMSKSQIIEIANLMGPLQRCKL